LQAIGWSNPQQFMAPPNAQAAPPPEMVKMQADAAAKAKDADARMMMAQAKTAETQAKIQQGGFAPKEAGLAGGDQTNNPIQMMEARARLMDAQTKAKDVAVKFQSQQMEDEQRSADRASKERLEHMEIAKDHMSDMMDLEKERLAAHVQAPVKGVYP